MVLEKKTNCDIIKVDDVYKALLYVLENFSRDSVPKTGIENPCFVHNSSIIGDNVYIGAFSYIDKKVVIGNNVKIFPQTYVGPEVIIEDNSILYAGCKIYSRVEIGKDCIIHSGSIIGSDGFGYRELKKWRL